MFTGMARQYPKRPAWTPPPPSGLYIAEYCRLRGITLHRLAELVDTTYTTIYRYITSKRQPSIEKLRPIATALGLSDVAELTKPPDTGSKESLLAGLTQEQRREVMNFIRFIRERGNNRT